METTQTALKVYRLKREVKKHPAGTLVGVREIIEVDTAEIAFMDDAKWHQIPADAIEEVPKDQIPKDLKFGA